MALDQSIGVPHPHYPQIIVPAEETWRDVAGFGGFY